MLSAVSSAVIDEGPGDSAGDSAGNSEDAGDAPNRDDDVIAQRQTRPDQARPGSRPSRVARRRRLHAAIGTKLDLLPSAVEPLVEDVRQVLVAPPRTLGMRIDTDDAFQAHAIPGCG